MYNVHNSIKCTYMYMYIQCIDLFRPAKLVMCVLTNTCMGIGITLVSEWEVRQQGLTVDTLLQPLTIEDDFHMGWVLFMLALDTLLFITVAWCVCVCVLHCTVCMHVSVFTLVDVT